MFSEEKWNNALDKRYGKELRKKISDSTVAVCGLGGLGSNIAVALARAGVGKLILIDFDRVDITNLHRQQYRADQIGMFKTEALSDILTGIAPYIKLKTHNGRMCEENIMGTLSDADIVCEAFDNAESKAMIVNTIMEKTDKHIVAASGMAGWDSANNIKTFKVTDRFYLCGDRISDVDKAGLVSSRVMLCAAHQAHTVLRILANLE